MHPEYMKAEMRQKQHREWIKSQTSMTRFFLFFELIVLAASAYLVF